MRFGLIGLGSIGQVRRTAIGLTPGCSLTAVFDADPARKAEGAQTFASAEALFAADVCDVIIISTPPDTHETMAIMAMQAGKHVIVEKPMANSLAACDRMLDVASQTGRVLTVGFNHRYFGAVKIVRAAVRSGQLGRLTHVRGYAGHVGLSEFKAPWMYDKKIMGGGTLMDNGIHMIDLVQHLMDGVESVTGVADANVWKLGGVEDNAFGLLKSPSGVTGSVHSSWSEWQGYRFHVEAYGDRGMARAYYAPMRSLVITMDQPGGPRRVQRNFYPGTMLREKIRGWQSTVVQTFIEELQDFIRLTRGEEQTATIARAHDGRRALAIANAVYTSSTTGETVRID